MYVYIITYLEYREKSGNGEVHEKVRENEFF